MALNSEQAAIEARIDWDGSDCRHRQWQYFEKINFWRDIFPGKLSLILPESNGEWISEDFPAGELVAPYSEGNIHRIRRSALKLQRKHGPAIEIVPGRCYPRYLAASLPGIYSGNVQPMRILEVDDDMVHIDLNHPLARTPLTVAARIRQRSGTASEHGGRCNDIVQDMLATGAGLQALQDNAATTFFSGEPFARLDARDDKLFYTSARLVQHLDTTALAQIKEIYEKFLNPGMQVLDLMSSWDSHLPDALAGLTVTGLGMNAEELAQNRQLAGSVIHDLNINPQLPFDDNRFDAAICTVSVEYLVRPVEVLRELGRVLKPGATAIMTFSDRWFPTKVIQLWTELHPYERMSLVLEYFRQAGNFSGLGTEIRRGLPRPEADNYAGQLALSDPVFAVWGQSSA